MEGPDIVLGVQWLLEFGEVRHNYITQTLVFQRLGETMMLKSYSNLCVQLVSPQSLQAMVNLNSIQSLFELSTIDSCSNISMSVDDEIFLENLRTTVPSPIATVINHYKTMFTAPSQLPPHRTIDHCIFIEPNSKFVNVRPYRCLHF